MGLGTYIQVAASNRQYTYQNIVDAYKRLTGNTLDRHYFSHVVFADSDGAIEGLALFCDYTGHSATIHLHMPKLLKKNAIKKILNYAFTELKIINLFAEFKSSNKCIYKVAERIGFNEIIKLENFYGPDLYDDAKIIMLAKENNVAKWIK